MWSSDFLPVNYDPWSTKHTLAKDLEPVYFQTGGIFYSMGKRDKTKPLLFWK